MKKHPSQPGPAGTSCLTCKRRRKKCDRTRPVCEACTKGGFECLGYEHLGQSSLGSSNDSEEVIDMSQSDYTTADLSLPESTPAYSTFRDWLALSRTSISGSMVGSSDFLTTTRQSSTYRYPLTESEPHTLHSQSILPCPLRTSLAPDDSMQMIGFIESQYARAVDISYFKPLVEQMAAMTQTLDRRFQASPASRLSMFIGCKIFQSSFDGTTSQTSLVHFEWLNRFEQQLHLTSARAISPAEVQERLTSSLEVAFLKLKLQESTKVPCLLISLAPIAQQLMVVELGSLGAGPISAAHVLASDRFELGHLMLMDTISSILYALPPVLDYDTSIPPFASGEHPMEMVHGCPTVLYFVLVKINTLLHKHRAKCELAWWPIEQDLKSWQPVVRKSIEEDSRMKVARVTIQESWRHTLLIYLYMAVCGVASDDIRVQESVRQVFRLIGSIPQPKTHVVAVHLIVQYIIAGACARSEKQRATARQVLELESDNVHWILRGKHFVPVLDHLWHGAAANGAPIRWTDYIHSRRIAAPLPFELDPRVPKL